MPGLSGDFSAELEALGAKDLLRRLRVLETCDARSARLDGRELLLFCGNDYLGLSHDPRVLEASARALRDHGAGSGAARLISGTSRLHAKLENELAAMKRQERALVFSAGYLANLGVLSAVAGDSDLILMDKLCHASLIDGARLSGAEVRVFPHKNYGRCAELLAQSEHRRRVLVSDTVFSMDGDLADVAELVRLKEAHDAVLVLDDAHATGVLGRTGAGALEDARLESRVDCITGTLSKAAGALGGFAAASNEFIDYLINRSRPFLFATALPPSVAAAALEAVRLMQKEDSPRQTLWQNAHRLHGLVASAGFASFPLESPIVPALVGPEKAAVDLSEALLERGILVPAIRTPTVPKGKARLRLTVTSRHLPADFEALERALASSGPPGDMP